MVLIVEPFYYAVVLIHVADRSYYAVVLIVDRSYYAVVLIADRSYYAVVLIATFTGILY